MGAYETGTSGNQDPLCQIGTGHETPSLSISHDLVGHGLLETSMAILTHGAQFLGEKVVLVSDWE